MKKIHHFNNGVLVYDHHLIDIQRIRYSEHNIHENEEEEIFIQLINNIEKQGCFVNIGSAIGYYIILAKKIRKDITIHAYEPLKIHRKYFHENIKLNRLKKNDIILHSEGINIKKSFAFLNKKRYGSHINNSISFRPSKIINSILNQKITIIRTITMFEILIKTNRKIDLLQMDIQGFEAEILNNAREILLSKQIKAFLIGTHGTVIHNKCLKILIECQYNIIFNIEDPKEQPDGIIVAVII